MLHFRSSKWIYSNWTTKHHWKYHTPHTCHIWYIPLRQVLVEWDGIPKHESKRFCVGCTIYKKYHQKTVKMQTKCVSKVISWGPRNPVVSDTWRTQHDHFKPVKHANGTCQWRPGQTWEDTPFGSRETGPEWHYPSGCHTLPNAFGENQHQISETRKFPTMDWCSSIPLSRWQQIPMKTFFWTLR